MQAVVGLNSGIGRDGIAGRVIARLDCDLPARTTLVSEADTASILDALLRHHEVIVVDEVRGGSPAGSIYRLTPEQYSSLERRRCPGRELGLADLVGLARSMGAKASVVVFGVEPDESWDGSPVWNDRVVRATAAIVAAELDTRADRKTAILRAS